MGMLNLLGVLSIIYTTILLAISFFVLFTARKADSKVLKNFGIVIAVLLWVSALLALSLGVSAACKGRGMKMRNMHRSMPGMKMQPGSGPITQQPAK